jgi:hypothetical protein
MLEIDQLIFVLESDSILAMENYLNRNSVHVVKDGYMHCINKSHCDHDVASTQAIYWKKSLPTWSPCGVTSILVLSSELHASL